MPYEQTVVLLPTISGVSVVCQVCAEREPELGNEPVPASLRLEDDLGWASCPKGHPIRLIRAGRVVFEEATSPLW
ncbi:MAG: hypothetical protein WBB74_08400 [Gaiellaceae bacterium]